MPGYVMHAVFAKLAGEKLGVRNNNRYLVGALIPDACTWDYDKKKEISHFTNKLYYILKNPDLDLFLQKYGHLLSDDVVLGIYSHLYLDKYFYNEFMYEIFEFSKDSITNKKTGRRFKIFEEFFVKGGIYEEYTAMNKMFIPDYNLDVPALNFTLNNLPEIEEYDFSKLAGFRKKIIGFLEEEGRYTGEYINYQDVRAFLEILSTRFVNHISEITK